MDAKKQKTISKTSFWLHVDAPKISTNIQGALPFTGLVLNGTGKNHDVDLERYCALMAQYYQNSDYREGYVCVDATILGRQNDPATIHKDCMYFVGKSGYTNFMLSIIATDSGIELGEQLLFKGINVHFKVYSLSQYERVLKAYLRAIEDRDIHFRPLRRIASVVSFDVRAVDDKVNGLLPKSRTGGSDSLVNKAAVAIGQLVFQKYSRYFSGESWKWLRDHGGQTQRLLWDVNAADISEYLPLIDIPNSIVGLSLAQINEMNLKTTESEIVAYESNPAAVVLRDLGTHNIHLDEVGEMLVGDLDADRLRN